MLFRYIAYLEVARISFRFIESTLKRLSKSSNNSPISKATSTCGKSADKILIFSNATGVQNDWIYLVVTAVKISVLTYFLKNKLFFIVFKS